MGFWSAKEVYVYLKLCRLIVALTSLPAIEDHIRSTSYTGDFTVSFETTASEISIRPSSALSRAMSETWIIVLLWLLLIYPFLWLFRRFHPRGGGKWEVCGAAYALKSPPVERAGAGGMKGAGMKEGEWFRMWQSTIAHGVRAKVKDSKPLECHGDPASTLDGY